MVLTIDTAPQLVTISAPVWYQATSNVRFANLNALTTLSLPVLQYIYGDATFEVLYTHTHRHTYAHGWMDASCTRIHQWCCTLMHRIWHHCHQLVCHRWLETLALWRWRMYHWSRISIGCSVPGCTVWSPSLMSPVLSISRVCVIRPPRLHWSMPPVHAVNAHRYDTQMWSEVSRDWQPTKRLHR